MDDLGTKIFNFVLALNANGLFVVAIAIAVRPELANLSIFGNGVLRGHPVLMVLACLALSNVSYCLIRNKE